MSNSTIIRAARNSDNPYAQIARSLFEDERISWQAKGMMGYLLSRKDGWRVFVADLQKRSTNGRDSCYAILDELGRCGYLERLEVREKGRIKGYEYVIHEVSTAERAASWKAVSGKTVSGKAVSGRTVSGKSPTSNNLILVSTEESKTEESKRQEGQAPPAQPDAPPQAAAEDLKATETTTENGSGASAEERSPLGSDQVFGQAPQEPEAERAPSKPDVPGAARAALRRAFSENFLTTLLGEYPDRPLWLELPPGRIDELLATARLSHGRDFKTPLIASLEAEVQAMRARASPLPAPLPPEDDEPDMELLMRQAPLYPTSRRTP